MGGLISNILLPIKAGYIKLFEINKYFAVFVPGLTPGMATPPFFKFEATSTGLIVKEA